MHKGTVQQNDNYNTEPYLYKAVVSIIVSIVVSVAVVLTTQTICKAIENKNVSHTHKKDIYVNKISVNELNKLIHTNHDANIQVGEVLS